MQRTQVRGVRRTPLEADQPAGEVFLQPGHRFTGGVGSRAVLLHPYPFNVHPFLLFDLPERLQGGVQVKLCVHNLRHSTLIFEEKRPDYTASSLRRYLGSHLLEVFI